MTRALGACRDPIITRLPGYLTLTLTLTLQNSNSGGSLSRALTESEFKKWSLYFWPRENVQLAKYSKRDNKLQIFTQAKIIYIYLYILHVKIK